MDKNKNNDRRWDVFKTISNVIIKVLAIFVAGTIVTFAVPVTIINIFQGNNPTNSSSIIEDLKTSKIENSILEVYDSSQGVADGNYGNAIVIDEVYTLYKRTMTQLECMETSFFLMDINLLMLLWLAMERELLLKIISMSMII